MAWAFDQVKELWQGQGKVEDLRQEEQNHGLAKVAEDADDGKGHAGKVAVRVADKD